MNDAQLVEACLEGDHRAYAVLVDRYRYPVFGLCLSYIKDFDAAEDAAQEALIAAYLKLESLPEPQKFGPWLRDHRYQSVPHVAPASAPTGRHRRRNGGRRSRAVAGRASAFTRAPAAGCGRCFPTEPTATTGRGPFLSRGPLAQADRRLSRRRGTYRRAAALPSAPQPKRGDDNYGQGRPARTSPA